MVYKSKNKDGRKGVARPGSRSKGQAAMEYLMTYGWAILVIVIVLALLAYFLPRFTAVPEVCEFSQPGFTCSTNPAIIMNTSTNQVVAEFNLQNGKGQAVNVSKVLCTTAAFADANYTFATQVPPAQQLVAAGSSEKMSSTCVDVNGNPISLTPNSAFQGVLVIYYNYVNDVTTVPRPADATLTGTVLG